MFNRNFAQLEYVNCRDLPHAPMPMQCYVHVKSQFRGKNTGSSIGKFPSLVQPRKTKWLQHFIIQFPLYYLLVVTYGRLKTKENFKLLAPKLVAVPYERWLLTRGSQFSDLAEKLLVFWKTGR